MDRRHAFMEMAREERVTEGQSARVAIVTGAARGIGRAMALGLLGSGYRVMASDIDPGVLDELKRAAGEHGAAERLAVLAADVARDETAAETVQATLARFGRLDIL